LLYLKEKNNVLDIIYGKWEVERERERERESD